MATMRLSGRAPAEALLVVAVLVGIVAALLVGIAAAAQPRCAEPPTPKEALASNDVVFAGRVLETAGKGRVAVVEVRSIWKGGDILGVTRVEGGDVESPSRDDRTFETGQQYVFFPRNDRPPFRDDRCSATTELTAAVARLEPDDAHAPRSGRGNSFVVVLVVAIVAAGVFQVRRALRSPPDRRPESPNRLPPP
jgi:hypothetical protein